MNDSLIGFLELLATIIFGVIGITAGTKWYQKQKQRVGKGSTAIQSGRDTIIQNQNERTESKSSK